MENNKRTVFNRSQFRLVAADLFNGQETYVSRDGLTYATRYKKSPPKHTLEHMIWRDNQSILPFLPR